MGVGRAWTEKFSLQSQQSCQRSVSPQPRSRFVPKGSPPQTCANKTVEKEKENKGEFRSDGWWDPGHCVEWKSGHDVWMVVHRCPLYRVRIRGERRQWNETYRSERKRDNGPVNVSGDDSPRFLFAPPSPRDLPSVSLPLSRPLRLLCANKGNLHWKIKKEGWDRKLVTVPTQHSRFYTERHTFGGFLESHTIQSTISCPWEGGARDHNRESKSESENSENGEGIHTSPLTSDSLPPPLHSYSGTCGNSFLRLNKPTALSSYRISAEKSDISQVFSLAPLTAAVGASPR